jgi:hypothetical protein
MKKLNPKLIEGRKSREYNTNENAFIELIL